MILNSTYRCPDCYFSMMTGDKEVEDKDTNTSNSDLPQNNHQILTEIIQWWLPGTSVFTQLL